MRMHVEGWAAALVHVMFHHEERPLAVAGEDLEGQRAVAHGVHLACAVGGGEDGRNRLGLIGLAERGCGDGGCGQRQERTTIHGFTPMRRN